MLLTLVLRLRHWLALVTCCTGHPLTSWLVVTQALYEKFESEGRARDQIDARKLWFAIMDAQVGRQSCPLSSIKLSFLLRLGSLSAWPVLALCMLITGWVTRCAADVAGAWHSRHTAAVHAVEQSAAHPL